MKDLVKRHSDLINRDYYTHPTLNIPAHGLPCFNAQDMKALIAIKPKAAELNYIFTQRSTSTDAIEDVLTEFFQQDDPSPFPKSPDVVEHKNPNAKRAAEWAGKIKDTIQAVKIKGPV